MAFARYFVPDHPDCKEVYSRDELRVLLQRGDLSRSDIVCDDETGLSHLLGDLLSTPCPDATIAPVRPAHPVPAPQRGSTRPSQPSPPRPQRSVITEFRGDTPLGDAASVPPAAADENATWDDSDFDDTPLRKVPIPSHHPALHRSADLDALPSHDDEVILFQGHPSWLAYPKLLLSALTAASLAVVTWHVQLGIEWTVLLASIAGLCALFISIERTSTAYFVTPRRVEMEFGILGRSTREVRITDIRAIDVIQGGYTALLGLGAVEFDSSASAGAEVVFRNVRGPHQIKELVRSLQNSAWNP